jgi:hypothetical protein
MVRIILCRHGDDDAHGVKGAVKFQRSCEGRCGGS